MKNRMLSRVKPLTIVMMVFVAAGVLVSPALMDTASAACGPGLVGDLVVPDKSRSFAFDFASACSSHDRGYAQRSYGRTEQGRAAVDLRFYNDMARECRNRYSWASERRWKCYAAAEAYYRAVRIAGWRAFWGLNDPSPVVARPAPLASTTLAPAVPPPPAPTPRTYAYRIQAGSYGGAAVRDVPSLSGRTMRVIPNGAVVHISCKMRGEMAYNNPYWNRLAEGGWLTDASVDTPIPSPIPFC